MPWGDWINELPTCSRRAASPRGLDVLGREFTPFANAFQPHEARGKVIVR